MYICKVVVPTNISRALINMRNHFIITESTKCDPN